MKDLEQKKPIAIETQSSPFGGNDVPGISIHTHEGRRHSAKQALAIGAVGLTLVGLAYSGLSDLGSQIWNDIKGAVPHQETQAQVFSALEKVSLPDKTILVEGTGTSSASLEIEYDSSGLPIGSWFWNHTFAKLTKEKAYAKRKGSVQIGSGEGAIALSAYRTGITSPDQRWGIQATVNSNNLSLSKDMNYVLDSSGQAEVQANDGFLIRLAGVVGISSDIAKRVANVTTVSDNSFENACGSALIPDISAGVKKDVRAYVSSTANLLQTRPGGQDSARILRNLVNEPMQVVFQRTRADTAHGRVINQTIEPAQIALPKQDVQTSQSIATTFGLPSNSVHLDTSGNNCYFTGPAIQDQVGILQQSASTVSSTKASLVGLNG